MPTPGILLIKSISPVSIALIIASVEELAKEVIQAIRSNYGMSIKIFDTEIPVAVKAAEASKEGKSIFSYDRMSKVASAYDDLAKEVIYLGERKRERDQLSLAR